MSIESLPTIKRRELKGDSDEKFYDEMMKIIKECRDKPDDLTERKKDLLERHPDRTDEIEVLFTLPKYGRIIQEIRKTKLDRKISSKERINNYRALTKFNCSLTRILINNKDNPENLRRFWNNFENPDVNSLNGSENDAIRRGLTGQSAIYQLLEELGYNPELPTTDEDAFAKIDLWCHNPETMIQVKTKQHLEEGIVECEEVPMSAVKCGKNYFSSHRLDEIAHIKGSTKSLSEFFERKIKSLKIFIPDHYFDPLTGKPTSECIESMKQKITDKLG